MHIIDGPNSEFAIRLIELRREAGVTQEELANAISSDKRSISTYENGHTFPREDKLSRLAAYFKVDAYWLSTGSSIEMRNYVREQNTFAQTSNFPSHLEFLHIESWEQINPYPGTSSKIYSEKPTCGAHSNDISLFLPIIKKLNERYRAIRMPFSVVAHPLYKKNSIIVINPNVDVESTEVSGSDIVFRITGKENTPGIRRLIKEAGFQPRLVSLSDPYSNVIEITDTNIEVLGVVIAVHLPHYV